MKFDPNSAAPEDDEPAQADFDPSTAAAAAPANPIRRLAGDMLAVPLAQGVVGVPQAIVGMADIVTGGRAGKAAEEAGFRPEEAKKIIGDALYSEEQQQANRAVAEADGFLPTIKALAENPSTIVRTAAESVPSMLAGGAVSRIARAAAPTINPVVAGAAGEGAIAAGAAAESIRGETANGLLTPGQAAAAAGTGLATGVISRLGGAAAQRLGIGDVDTALATGRLGPAAEAGQAVADTAAKKGFLRKALEGVITEGALEEMPQSAVEQIIQNIATDKPWHEGVGSAAAMGLATGGLVGGAIAPWRGGPQPAQDAPAAPPLLLENTPDPLLGFPDGTVARRSEVERYIASLPADQQPGARARFMGLGPQPGDETTLGAAPPRTPQPPLNPPLPLPPSAMRGDLVNLETAPGAAPPRENELPYEPVLGSNPNIMGRVGDPVDSLHRGPVNVNLEPGPISRAAMLALPPPNTVTPGETIAVDSQGNAGGQSTMDLRAREATGTPNDRPGGDWRGAARPDPNAGPISRAASIAPMPAAPAQPATTGEASSVPRETAEQPLQPGEFVVDEHFAGAHRAATSPLNQRSQPSDAQKDAENYAVGRTRVGGMAVSLENPQGTQRTGRDEDGNEWSTLMQDHYGRLPGTIAADSTKKKKQGLDVFIKRGTPKKHNGPVFVVDQVNQTTGKFDEHKVIFGATDEADAATVYRRNYDAGWNGLGAITRLPASAFKSWAYDGKRKTAPLGDLSKWRAGTPLDIGAAPARPAASPAAGPAAPADGAGRAATFDASTATLDDVAPVPDGPVGRFGTPIEAGGKPWTDRKQADAHRRKFRPGYRVQEVEGGFILRPKTDAELEQEKAAGERRQRAARSAAYDANPFMTFLATHGLYHEKDKPGSQMREFSPDRPIMVGGYGPVFRSDGKLPDALVQPAIEEGYLPRDADERDLEELIQHAIRGNRVAPLYTEDAAAREFEAMMQERRELDAAEAEAAMALSQVDDDVLEQLEASFEDDGIPWDGPGADSNIDDALIALGYTEEDIHAAAQATEEPEEAPAGREGGQGPGQAAEAQGEAAGAGRAPAPDAGVDLLGEAPSDAQQAAARARGEREEADRRRQQTAPGPEGFVLSGSDRPADQAAARGQTGLFDESTAQLEDEAPAAAPAAPLPNATAPEHVDAGVDPRELGEIVDEFNSAQARMIDGDEPVTHIFDAPPKGEVVRLQDKVRVYNAKHGWMSVDEAKARIAEWKEHARSQAGAGNDNSDRVVLSLFDLTGSWSQPWAEAGYDVYRFDIQEDPENGDVTKFDVQFFSDTFGMFEGREIYAILAATPCTDFAASGARHFAAKDADGRTIASVKLVHATLATIEYFKPAVWAVENPVGRIEKLGGLPPWRLSFDPNHLGDPYTKKTLLWGRFNGDLPIAPVEPTEGSKMHRLYGGKSQKTKNARSETPEGFAYAFFMANNAVDNPLMAVANRFDRLDRGLLQQALDKGMKERDIASAVEDHYYDLDDEGAEEALREAIAEFQPPKPKAAPAPAPANDEGALRAELDDIDAKLARGKGGNPGKAPTRTEQSKLNERRAKVVDALRAIDDATAAPADDATMTNYIRAAADSIEQLRKVDVERVLSGLREGNIDGLRRIDLAAWITEKRPDLAGEVSEVMAELKDAAAPAPKPEWPMPTPAKPKPLAAAAASVVNGQPRDPSIPADDCLLLMPCSEGKLPKAGKAGDLYQGVMWQTLRTHRQPGKTPRMAILSAEHGFIGPDTEIDPYERKMDNARRDGLLLTIDRQVKELREMLPAKPLRDVQIVGGTLYRAVMRAAVAELQAAGAIAPNASIREVSGGIGEQRQQLGQYLDGFEVEADSPAAKWNAMSQRDRIALVARAGEVVLPTQAWDAIEPARRAKLERAMVREVITPADDEAIGKNDAGEDLYRRKDGSVYRMHAGKPDFGGDLAPKVAKSKAKPANSPQPAAAPSSTPAAESGDLNGEPMPEPKVLYRSVSPREWEAIQKDGNITGGANRFNPFDSRRKVFFGDALNARLIHQGEEVTRRAEYAVSDPANPLQKRLTELLEEKRQLQQQREEKAAAAGTPLRDMTPLQRRVAVGQIDQQLRDLENEEQELREKGRQAIKRVAEGMRGEDAQRGYTSVVLKTRPIDGGLVYTGRHSGMGEDAEYGFEPGAVTMDDIDTVTFVKDGQVLREEPAAATLSAPNTDAKPGSGEARNGGNPPRAADDAAKPPGTAPAKLKNYSWDPVKLSNAYNLEQLNALRLQVEAEHANPKDAAGGYLENGRPTIHLYDAKGRKKLDALSWAVTHVLKHKKDGIERPQDAPPPASHVDAHVDTMNAVRAGTATVEQYRAGFAAVIENAAAMRAELNAKTKDELLRAGGGYFAMRHKADKKAEIVDALYKAIVDEYSLGKQYGPSSYFMTRDGLAQHTIEKRKALTELVQAQTAEDLAAFAASIAASREETKARRAAKAAAIENPETIEELRAFIQHHKDQGQTFEQARMLLPVDKRAKFDLLTAQEARERRGAQKDAQRQVRTASTHVQGGIIETKHTKKGHDLYVVQLAERVPREDYDTLNAGAKKLGGYYSSYRGGGAVPGFQFTDRKAAEAFVQLAGGSKDAAQEVASARRDAFEDDRTQSAAQRLTAMADRLEDMAQEELARDRKTNTARRAGMAARAEAAAQSNVALAGTMRRIAEALEAGRAQMLDRVRQRTQVELLERTVRTAKDEELRTRYPSYADYERHKGEAPTSETADFARFPQYTLYRSDLASLARQLLEVDGMKMLGQRLMKVADDVSDAYTKFAKENLLKVSAFARGNELANFDSKEAAERSLRRSGLVGKAYVLQIKRGQHRIVLSPSEAIKRGIWQGDGDQRITLTHDFAEELVQKASRRGKKLREALLPWQIETTYERRQALSRMGIETPAEFRAAVREYIELRQAPKAPDRVKELERSMIGRKNDGLDFFPTPEGTADEMVETAGITEGMRVLEPSAGWGHIAERIRAAGVEPEVVEMANERFELLEAKGFNVIGRDFLHITPDANGLYDRIVMNPPFSEGRDIQHVRHAYNLLKPGGRLVAIMGEGAFTNTLKRAEEFRAWLDEVGGTEEKLAEGTFTDSSLPVNTGVNARMVVIDKADDEGQDALDEGSIWRSDLEEAIGKASMKQAPAKGWLDFVNGLVQRGVKAAELEWSGIREWLQLQGDARITRDDVLGFLDDNGVKVTEVAKGEGVQTDAERRMLAAQEKLHALGWRLQSDVDGEFAGLWHRDNQDVEYWFDNDTEKFADEDGNTLPDDVTAIALEYGQARDEVANAGPSSSEARYSQYQLPGGTKYREVLLTLPSEAKPKDLRPPLTELPADYENNFDSSQPVGKQWSVIPPGQLHARPYAGIRGASPEEVRPQALAVLNSERDNADRDAVRERAFRSNHRDERNIVAHIRLTDRQSQRPMFRVENKVSGHAGPEFDTREEAEASLQQYPEKMRANLRIIEGVKPVKTLFVEELQSDWAQDGRREGFKDATPEPEPFTALELETARARASAVLAANDDLGYPSTQAALRVVRNGFLDNYDLDPEDRADVARYVEIDKARQDWMNRQNRGVPRAPFVESTTGWLPLAIKRVIKMATDEGYDRVAFINGQQSVDRYPQLSKVIDSLDYIRRIGPDMKPNGLYDITAKRGGRAVVQKMSVDEKQLRALIGEEVTQRIIDAPEPIGSLTGMQLEVGNRGMLEFYDRVVPRTVNDVLRKLGGGKVAPITIPNGELSDAQSDAMEAAGLDLTEAREMGMAPAPDVPVYTQLGFEVTPAMREQAARGMPLFRQDAPGARPAAGGMSVRRAQKAVDRITKGWKGGFEIRVVATSADLPGRSSNARGRYINGIGYIVADKHRTLQEVGRTLAHEVINHHGLRTALGKDRWRQLMLQIQAAARAGNVDVKAAQDIVRLAYRKPDGSFLYADRPELEADEIAARLIEQSVDENGEMRPRLQWLKWVWAKLADFLRGVGLDIPFTTAELHGIFVAARRNLEAGPGGQLPAGLAVSAAAQDAQDGRGFNTREIQVGGKWRPIENSRGQLLGTEFAAQSAFWRWARNTQALDAQGRPLVLYHGARQPENGNGGFKVFMRSSYGFMYATPDSSYASSFGSSVYPVYMRAENPLDAREFGELDISPAEWQKFLQDRGVDTSGLNIMRDADRFGTTQSGPGFKVHYPSGMAVWQWLKKDGVKDALVAAGFDSVRMIEGVSDEAPTGVEAWVAFDPSQFKSAVGNKGTFDPLDDSILDARDVDVAGDTGRQYTPEQLAAMERVGFATRPEPLAEKAKRLWANAGKMLAQGIVDQFAPIKDISREAYGLLRLSKGASGAFEVMLQGGQLKLADGVYDFDESKRGGVVERLLVPLQGEHHDFLRWVAANRAEQLAAEDREHLFTPQDIASLKSLADGTLEFDFKLQHGPRAGQTTRSRTEAYRDSLATFNEFNKNTLDMAEQSGLIDGASRHLWEKAFYVPFYRVMEDGNLRGMNIKSGVVRQQAFKALKGGEQKLNVDLLENTLMNWAHLLDAAAKNRAAKATLEALERVGHAVEADEATVRQMAKSLGRPDGVVWFMDQGRQRHYLIEDPYLMTAVSALEFSGMRSPIMNALGTFKHALTVGVTASPFFKVRNLIRDSIQAIATSPLGANPAANVAQGWRATAPESAEYFRLLAGGGTIHFGTMMEGSEARRVQALVESGVDRATILDTGDRVKAFYRRFVEPAITAYNELGNRGEAVNRAALYQQLRAQGKSHAEASLMARDLMDFSMQGSFTTVRFLTQVVPFLNARLQGLYKLGRGAAEDPARAGMVLGAVTLVSIGLLAAYGDDDDWKKREDWDRNNYWWFKMGGVAFRIPKPFEIGAIATLAERSFELWFTEEMTSRRFRQNVLDLLGDNLALNPVPQLVKPIIDVYANVDSFTGRPIESMGMERLRADYRFDERTTMGARAASTTINAVTRLVGAEGPSPVQIDHLVRGYFGWLGSMVVSAGDVIARPATGQAERPTPDYWRTLTGAMVSSLEDAPSRYVSAVYDQAKALEQAYGTWRHLLRQGQVEEAQAFREEYAQELARYRQVEAVKRAMANLNALRRQIEASGATADEKRQRLRELDAQRDSIARRLQPV